MPPPTGPNGVGTPVSGTPPPSPSSDEFWRHLNWQSYSGSPTLHAPSSDPAMGGVGSGSWNNNLGGPGGGGGAGSGGFQIGAFGIPQNIFTNNLVPRDSPGATTLTGRGTSWSTTDATLAAALGHGGGSGDGGSGTATPFDQNAFDAQMKAIQGLSDQMSGANAQFAGQYGAIDQSLSAQESNAQKSASNLARNEITTNNLQGGSGGGGAAQAGAAQAALGGESLMNQAISQAAAQRIQVAQNQTAYMSHIADQQYDIAKTAYSASMTAADQDRANNAMLLASQSSAQFNALGQVLANGGNLDPAAYQMILNQIATPGVA